MKLAFSVLGILLILLILARKSESGGLTSAFGGFGGSEALGVKATKQLDKVITVMATILFLLAVLLNMTRPTNSLSRYVDTKLQKPVPTQPSETPSNPK